VGTISDDGRKPLDEALRRLLDEQAKAVPAAAPAGDAELVELRRGLLEKALASRTSIPGLPNDVTASEVSLSDTLTGRLYKPSFGARPRPLLVYLHGGGWVAGSVATHDPFCRLLCAAAGTMILSVEYRRAPEAPYPAAVEDASAALSFAFDHAPDWGASPQNIAIGGDSAGANLAAVVANHISAASDRPPLRALLLLYPVTDHPSANHPSYLENATGFGLEANLMRWFWNQYAAGVPPQDANISPLRLPALPPLPPTLIATAEYDVLRDEGIAYVEKLRHAGVAVTHLHAADMNHNFAVHPATVARFPQSRSTLGEIASWLRTTMART